MAPSQWRPVGLVDFARLREARVQAHHAAQWLARTARAYIPPQPDDGHTNLGWDDGFDGLITHPFADDAALGLRFPNLTLALLRKGKITQVFPLHARNDTEVRAWLGERLDELKLPSNALDEPLPYALPAQSTPYEAGSSGPLRELAAWYANGFHTLDHLRTQLGARGLRAPVVRLWPHHFDLDCLTVIGDGAAYAVPTMGAGFSGGDQYYEEPYFYISLYPRPDLSALPKLDAPGHWHTQDFLAALLSAGRILPLRDRQAETEAFLNSTSDRIVKVLTGGAPQPVK